MGCGGNRLDKPLFFLENHQYGRSGRPAGRSSISCHIWKPDPDRSNQHDRWYISEELQKGEASGVERKGKGPLFPRRNKKIVTVFTLTVCLHDQPLVSSLLSASVIYAKRISMSLVRGNGVFGWWGGPSGAHQQKSQGK